MAEKIHKKMLVFFEFFSRFMVGELSIIIKTRGIIPLDKMLRLIKNQSAGMFLGREQQFLGFLGFLGISGAVNFQSV